jgi:predicted TIM-barrel fold metal-dependent hydrolase
MKAHAPRLWRDSKGVFQMGMAPGHTFLPPGFIDAVSYFERVPGCEAANLQARLSDMDAEGVAKAQVFPNEVLGLLGFPNHELREACFRIYNQYIAEWQARAPGRIYAVGLINWWDKTGARRTLDELKSLGLKTFLMPLNGMKFPNGDVVDYCGKAMIPVWEEIEASGIPVSHHIGEGNFGNDETNPIASALLQMTHSFREMFAKYVFGGILDRHPGLQVGWFEGGINWVVSTLQDAKYIDASAKHTYNTKLKHEPEYYWRNHMYSSFMVDPLGLEMIDRIGDDRAMWSTDYPHNESTFGYSRSSLRSVVNAVGPERAKKIASENVVRYLKL